VKATTRGIADEVTNEKGKITMDITDKLEFITDIANTNEPLKLFDKSKDITEGDTVTESKAITVNKGYFVGSSVGSVAVSDSNCEALVNSRRLFRPNALDKDATDKPEKLTATDVPETKIIREQNDSIIQDNDQAITILFNPASRAQLVEAQVRQSRSTSTTRASIEDFTAGAQSLTAGDHSLQDQYLFQDTDGNKLEAG